MKPYDQTFLEIINHLVIHHPNLLPSIEELILKVQNKSKQDSEFFQVIHADLFRHSKSQLRQDMFVLHQLAYKRNGYFVEFGATNGVDLSNTHMLEKHFGWTGILAEPARCWHEALRVNRSCNIEKKCVWSSTGNTLVFNETQLAELSTINQFSGTDGHFRSRENGVQYPVTTISLNDLLEKYQAPKSIDYLSIDTEGSEYEILSNLDFTKYSFGIITVEHNSTPARDLIHELLVCHNYYRIFETLSKWDDWYIFKQSDSH